MTKMIEIPFEYDVEQDAVVAIPIGRLHLGDHIARLVFSPDGKVRLVVPKEALDDGSILCTYRGVEYAIPA